MSEMVERVARALDPEAFGHDFPVMAAKHYEVRRSISMKRARAAIEAMREPTEAMVKAVYDQADPGFCDEPGESTSPRDAWQQMIDEALK